MWITLHYGHMKFLQVKLIKKPTLLLLTLLISLILLACQKDDLPNDAFIHIYDISLRVDEIKDISILTNIKDIDDIVYTTTSTGIKIDQNRVYGVKAGTSNMVTATYQSLSTTFEVVVFADRTLVGGPLFDDIVIEPLDSLSGRDDFMMGVDLSSIVEVTNRGGKFYDISGQRTSIYQLLADRGVNYIRIRLWNDPKSPSGVLYGGGNNDLEVAKDIGYRAKLFGMKILLNFHYSDFWADPGKQVIPKEWSHLTTAIEISQAIYDFTYDAMEQMEQAGAKVDMVQIGNEIAPGMITQGTNDYETLNTDSPERYALSASISGSTQNIQNLILYLNAGLTASKAQHPEVLRMIHIDRGGNNAFYRTFFDRLAEHQLDYEIIGMSYYVFYHGSLENFTNNINDIAARYQKQIVIAETSYGFTNQNVANAAHILTQSYFNYPLSPQGQVDVMRDIIDVVARVEHHLGLGIFYWEPAWLPVAGAGWAGAGTPITWANQALFSYQGIELPSLAFFRNLRPNA